MNTPKEMLVLRTMRQMIDSKQREPNFKEADLSDDDQVKHCAKRKRILSQHPAGQHWSRSPRPLLYTLNPR